MSIHAIETTYTDVERLVWNLVHKFCRKHGCQFGHPDELFSVAGEGFCIAYKLYDQKKARCFTTYVYHVVQHTLLQHIRTHCKHPKTEVLPDEAERKGSFCLPDFLDDLSEDSRFVAELILESPQELLQALFDYDNKSTARSYRAGIRKYLQKLGWLNSQITAAFDELCEAIN